MKNKEDVLVTGISAEGKVIVRAGMAYQSKDLADYETTTESTIRSTQDRNRSNHTGTQLASTISDFDNKVSTNNAVNLNSQKVSNVKGDWNAVTGESQILNKPNLSVFETSSELDVRDTNNRKRQNATGTQLSSTISDFNEAVLAVSPVNDLTLGETQTKAYRGDRGKEAYEHAKSAHAPSDAQRNVKPNWNATTGDGEILNKPTAFPPTPHEHQISQVQGLEFQLNTREKLLGNPTVNGQVLSSTVSGERTWITPSTGGGAVDISGKVDKVGVDDILITDPTKGFVLTAIDGTMFRIGIDLSDGIRLITTVVTLVTDKDILITNYTKGFVLKDSLGNLQRITVEIDGRLTTTNII